MRDQVILNNSQGLNDEEAFELAALVRYMTRLAANQPCTVFDNQKIDRTLSDRLIVCGECSMLVVQYEDKLTELKKSPEENAEEIQEIENLIPKLMKRADELANYAQNLGQDREIAAMSERPLPDLRTITTYN